MRSTGILFGLLLVGITGWAEPPNTSQIPSLAESLTTADLPSGKLIVDPRKSQFDHGPILLNTSYELDESGNLRQASVDWNEMIVDEIESPVVEEDRRRFENWEGSLDILALSRDDDRGIVSTYGADPDIRFEIGSGGNAGLRLRASHGIDSTSANNGRLEYAWIGVGGEDVVTDSSGSNGLEYSYGSKLNSMESNVVVSKDSSRGFSALLGGRIVMMNDSLDMVDWSNTYRTQERQEARNRMFGLQLGFRRTWIWEYVYVGLSFKAGAFYNHYTQTGPEFSGTRLIGVAVPDYDSSDGALSTLGEYELELGYRMTDRASVGLGLFGMTYNQTVEVGNAWGAPADPDSTRYVGLALAMDYDF